MKPLKILYGITAAFVFLVLAWLLAVPNELIKQKAENAVSRVGDGSMTLSIKGIRKGIFFSLYADSIDLGIGGSPAITINDLSISLSPRLLSAGELAFIVKGRLGTGTIDGTLKLPMKGDFRIDNAELGSITYLKRFGLDAGGHLTSDIELDNGNAGAVFNIPDLDIRGASMVPLINTFHRIQGSVQLEGNDLRVDSISLEGDKGFARLKGRIRNGVADMVLELMPVEQSLNTLESMIIGKYIVSPGYYSVPIKGPIAVQ